MRRATPYRVFPGDAEEAFTFHHRVGSAALTSGTSQADVDGLPCYLDASTQRAVDFYRFDVVGREDLDGHIMFGLVLQAAAAREDHVRNDGGPA